MLSWYPLTTINDIDGEAEGDINKVNPDLARTIIAPNSNNVLLAIVKKNSSRLSNLHELLKAADENNREHFPVLIIDDESDQATPNTRLKNSDISTINKRIRSIWNEVRVGTYVAYTATPYANLLMDPNDEEEMYPSDFFYPLQEPQGYLGARAYFGRELEEPIVDAVREIPELDLELLDYKKNCGMRSLDNILSLPKAIQCFIVATAIRHMRGQQKDSTMLIHNSMNTDDHQELYDAVKAYIDQQQAMLKESGNDISSSYKQIYDEEYAKTASYSWEELWPEVKKQLMNLTIAVDNSKSDIRLEYTEDAVQTVIVIGGNTLSRGLTLEGLVCSYFTRTTKTYDALMQMGRWFGFRPGYEDLVRVWIPNETYRYFNFLADVEEDIRAEARKLASEKRTPGDIGLKIRTHPGALNVTAASKMHLAKTVQLSLNSQRLQTHIFSIEEEVIAHNRKAVAHLIHSVDSSDAVCNFNKSHRIYRDVSAQPIIDFFNSMAIHKRLKSLQPELVVPWIRDYAPDAKWNVVFVSPQKSQATADFEEFSMSTSFRSKLRGSPDDEVNLKALIAPNDLWLDYIELPTNKDITQAISMRKTALNGNGLLLIYMVDKDSPVSELSSVHREPLDAPAHVPAFGIVFPHVDVQDDDNDYISVDIQSPQDFYSEELNIGI